MLATRAPLWRRPELLGGGLGGQRGVLLVLRITALLLVPLLVAALRAQLVEALAAVTFVGHEEVPQVQTAHRLPWKGEQLRPAAAETSACDITSPTSVGVDQLPFILEKIPPTGSDFSSP